MPEIPPAWADLIEGLTILGRHAANPGYPLCIEHERLYVLSDATSFTAEELDRLETLGFAVNREGGFYSFRVENA